jgi:hypothetical protein
MRAICRPFILACLAFFACLGPLAAQTVVAFQGGEGTPADNWGFLPILNVGGPIAPGIVAVAPKTGTFAIRAGGGTNIGCTTGTNCITGGANTASGCAMHGNTVQFNAINVACLAGVQLSVSHRSHPSACSGAGWDASDNLNFEVRLDGGAWTTVQTLSASGDYLWSYATNPAGIPATVPNPWLYTVPPGTNTFEFRVRATVNRSDEVFYLDDVTLTTTSTGYGFPGTAGLWNGLADDNWFNACNWSDRLVPTAATNVTFPTGSANDIVIQPGQNCQCNNLTCTGGAGRAIIAAAGPTKVLTVFGNLLNSTTAGSTVLRFSDGTPGTPDGTLNLSGNWTNNSSSGDFVEGESTVNFVGNANQTITLGTVQPTEDFFNLTVNKPGGDLVLAKSAQVSGVLTLTNGKITTGANTVAVANPLPAAVTGHSTASYVNGNLVRAIQTGAGIRTYDYPLGTPLFYELASLALTNPAGFTAIGGFFNPLILGVAPSINEAGFLHDEILNAGVWTLAPDLPYIGTYDITLVERGYTNGAAVHYINVKRPDAASAWANPGTAVSFSEIAGVVTCQRSGLTAFSDFAIAREHPLALDDLGLFAHPVGQGDIAIDWNWSDGLVQGKFELERTHEGQVVTLGEWPIDPALHIATQDLGAPTGLLHYTLYHIDLDGNRIFTATAKVLNTTDGRLRPLLWPNPNDGEVHLQLSGETAWKVSLLRADGAAVMEWSGDASTVQGHFETLAPSLPAGVYLVKCVGDGKSYSLKMVKQ